MGLSIEKARESLVRVGRRIAEAGLVTGTWGNLSVRVLEEDAVVVTPSGLGYDRLSPADMVVVDPDGRVLDGALKPSTELALHLEIYRARDDVRAVVHTHSTYATALAVAGVKLPVILEELAQVIGGTVRVASYAMAGTRELAFSAVRALGKVNAVLLANHGVVGVGRSLEEALQACLTVEKGAQIYLLACQAGKPGILGDTDVQALRSFFVTAYGQKSGEES